MRDAAAVDPMIAYYTRRAAAMPWRELLSEMTKWGELGEDAHMKQDELLCIALLKARPRADVVALIRAYESSEKWYA